jgi:hypothetical protein
MSAKHAYREAAVESADDELRRDRRTERALAGKGVLALVVTCAVAYVRQRYLV